MRDGNYYRESQRKTKNVRTFERGITRRLQVVLGLIDRNIETESERGSKRVSKRERKESERLRM